jgi:hypothetical protein
VATSAGELHDSSSRAGEASSGRVNRTPAGRIEQREVLGGGDGRCLGARRVVLGGGPGEPGGARGRRREVLGGAAGGAWGRLGGAPTSARARIDPRPGAESTCGGS